MHSLESGSSLEGIPFPRWNGRKSYYDLAAPPRSVPRCLHWNLLVGGFRHQRVWLITFALLSLFGVGAAFLHRVARLELPPGPLGSLLAGIFLFVTPFIVMILRTGRRRGAPVPARQTGLRPR